MMEIQNFKDELLNEILKRLVSEFHPLKVYLFGSRAKGLQTPESDYDLLLIIKESDLSRHERMTKALTVLWGCGAKVDVFVYTEAEFSEWKNEFSSIPHTVATEGLELKVG